jgi:HAD superfamily hydrolase (TIGR01662 family)
MIKAVLFDWGNTVMEDLPGMTGAMADWPSVAATPGIREVLTALDGQVITGIATNASESDSPAVRKALARVDLDRFFAKVFTARDLHSRKPDPVFFQSMAEQMGCFVNECLMVGDSLEYDADGAARAGMHAIWLKRSEETVTAHPRFDGMIAEYGHFESAFRGVMQHQIPTLDEAMNLLRLHKIKPGLLRHVQKVALAAYFMADALLANGVDVDPVVAHRAGLLHDIDKFEWMDSGYKHGEYGAHLVEDAGYPLAAAPIRTHQVFNILTPQTRPATWEEKLVYLADKYMEKDQMVTVEERVGHLIQRYPNSAVLLRDSLPFILALEDEVIKRTGNNQQTWLANLIRKVNRVDLEELQKNVEAIHGLPLQSL